MTNDLNPAGVEAAAAALCLATGLAWDDIPEMTDDDHNPTGAETKRYFRKWAEPAIRAYLASLPQPEGETAELVERLRALVDVIEVFPELSINSADAAMAEAADAITAVTAERDEARAQIAHAREAAIEECIVVVKRMLVFSDTTSRSDTAIEAALRALGGGK